MTRKSSGTFGLATLAVGALVLTMAPVSAQAGVIPIPCTEDQELAYELLELVGYMSSEIPSEPDSRDCDTICRSAELGCKKIGFMLIKGMNAEFLAEAQVAKTLCKTATSETPSECKGGISDARRTFRTVLKEVWDEYKLICADSCIQDTCADACTNGTDPGTCEEVFAACAAP